MSCILRDLDRFLWKDGVYASVVMPVMPDTIFFPGNTMTYETEESFTATQILGKYYAKINEISRDQGRLTGGIMIRAAFQNVRWELRITSDTSLC